MTSDQIHLLLCGCGHVLDGRPLDSVPLEDGGVMLLCPGCGRELVVHAAVGALDLGIIA